MADTIGDRVYAIRLARGDGKRSPMPLRAFAELVRDAGGKWVDPSTLSLIERDMQRASIDDIEAIAAADPEHRGRSWLAFGLDERLLKMDEIRGPALRAFGDPRLTSLSTLDPFIRQGYYGLAQNMSLEELREFALQRLSGWFLKLDEQLSIDPTGLEDDRQAINRYHATSLARIRNRRGVVDYLIESMDLYFLSAVAATTGLPSERLDEVTQPTPRPEALVPLANDEKGTPLQEAEAVVMDPIELQMQEDEDRLAEFGILRPHWMREFESRKLTLQEERRYFEESLHLRGQFCVAKLADKFPAVREIVRQLEAAFKTESMRARSSSMLQTLALRFMDEMISRVVAATAGNTGEFPPTPTVAALAKQPERLRSTELRKAIALPLTDFHGIADRAERGELFKHLDDEHMEAERTSPPRKPKTASTPKKRRRA